MAWPMHIRHRHDHDQYRWERPPQVEEGQTALVHAPTATALLERQATPERADRSPASNA